MTTSRTHLHGPRPSAALAIALTSPALAGCVDLLGDFQAGGCRIIDCQVAWSTGIGGTGEERVSAVAIDPAGGVYIAGQIGAPVVFGGESLPYRGASDAFVAKLDPDGEPVWGITIGGGDVDRANALAVEPVSGDVYVTGMYTGNALVGQSIMITSMGGIDMFLARLRGSDGTPVWAETIGSVAYEEATGIALDPAGNIFLTGSSTTLRTDGTVTDTNAFFLRLDTNGAILSQPATDAGAGEAAGRRIVVDSAGRAFSAGWFGTDIDFGITYHSEAINNVFLAELTPADGLDKARVLSSLMLGVEDVGGLAVANGGLRLAGSYAGKAAFGQEPRTSANERVPFLVDLDAAGTSAPPLEFPGPTPERVHHAAFDPGGGAYLTGAAQLDPTDANVFLLRVDPDGNSPGPILWGGPGVQRGTAVAVGNGDVILAGDYDQAFGFDNGALPHLGSSDVFVIKLTGAP